MTVQERLHRLVDVLPEAELVAAARYLEYLASVADPVALALALAPDDDEPLTEADRAALAEGWADYAAGRGASAEDVKRDLGLS